MEIKVKKVKRCLYNGCGILGAHRHYSGNGCVVVIPDEKGDFDLDDGK